MAILRPALRRLADLRRRLLVAELPTRAAAVAYHSFLALVPLALALFGAAAFVGESERAVERVRATLEVIAPPDVVEFFTGLLAEAEDRVGGQQGWVIAVSVLGALFLGSRAAVSLQRALAGVEGSADPRRGWRARLVALGLTVGGGAALAVTSLLLVAGGRLVGFAAELTGAGWLPSLWSWLRLPVSGLGIFAFLVACYRWGPPRPLPRPLLGALVGTAGVLAASLAFGLYLAVAPVLGATFGVLGAVAVALVWLYLGALAVMLGAVAVSDGQAPGSSGAEPAAGRPGADDGG